MKKRLNAAWSRRAEKLAIWDMTVIKNGIQLEYLKESHMKWVLLSSLLTFGQLSFAYEAQFKKGTIDSNLSNLIDKVNETLKSPISESDLFLVEKTELATSEYLMYVQHIEHIPVNQTAVRIWKDKATKELILAEVHLNEANLVKSKELSRKFKSAKFSKSALRSKQLHSHIALIVENEVQKYAKDSRVLGMKFNDIWKDGDLIRSVEVKGRRGIHLIDVSLLKNKVIQTSYIEFQQSEKTHSFKANVFPIYEEVEATGEKLTYEVKDLKHIYKHLPDGGLDPLGAYSSFGLLDSRYNAILATTEFGKFYGYWSEATLRDQIASKISSFPLMDNSFEKGLRLQGKYVSINLHPDIKKFEGVNFPLKKSHNHIITWTKSAAEWMAKPVSGYFGKTINSDNDVLNILPERRADHDPVQYMNSGFDEIQVYYGVTVFMETLGEMGFEDKKLSTDPFHAFLYDPDIAMKDNAYYYDNTINFTTYSPSAVNYARDNPTIWHELGHGVMDRLMGPHLGFAGTDGGYGGLSEGMADFLAQIIVEHQTSGSEFAGKNEFRIINETGFSLTNEFHDEGEAYGGAMNDMLQRAIKEMGREGLFDFADLTIESMRLTRNHPALSPQGWFEHMLYADELGSEVREPGKFKEIILEALVSRNFSFNENFKEAKMEVSFGEEVLSASGVGSRNNPLTPCGVDGFVSYDLKIKLNSGDAEFIKFPATVKVEFKKGALQGAIRWVGEDTNPVTYVIQKESDILDVPIKASAECEQINQADGSCKDYAYLQIFNVGQNKPVAKKRFYLSLNQELCQ